MEPTNDERAGWAMAALREFCGETGRSVADEIDDAIVDLIADLLHLADRHGPGAESALRQAKNHHDCELAEEGV